MVRTPRFHFRGHRFNPWSGNYNSACRTAWLKNKTTNQPTKQTNKNKIQKTPTLVMSQTHACTHTHTHTHTHTLPSLVLFHDSSCSQHNPTITYKALSMQLPYFFPNLISSHLWLHFPCSGYTVFHPVPPSCCTSSGLGPLHKPQWLLTCSPSMHLGLSNFSSGLSA